jgi:MOSC domain-containing protein YiiM
MTDRPWVLAVSVGVRQTLPWRNRTVTTAIAKVPTAKAVEVGHTGLAGDEQGDRVHHGGPAKAVMVYPSEHYTAWGNDLGRSEFPAFGENLTTAGLLERDVVLGTVYRIGTVTLQVTQPRQPCYKLAAFHDRRDMAVLTQQTGRTGFYLRVLQPGQLRAGDPIEVISRPGHGITAAEVHRVLNLDRNDRAAARHLLAHPDVLPVPWQEKLHNRLTGELDDQSERLYGTATSDKEQP